MRQNVFLPKANTEMLCASKRGWTSLFCWFLLLYWLNCLKSWYQICITAGPNPGAHGALFMLETSIYFSRRKVVRYLDFQNNCHRFGSLENVIITSSQQTRHGIKPSCQAHLHLTGWLNQQSTTIGLYDYH